MTGHFLSGIWPRLVSNRDRAGATRGYVWSHDSYTVSQNSVYGSIEPNNNPIPKMGVLKNEKNIFGYRRINYRNLLWCTQSLPDSPKHFYVCMTLLFRVQVSIGENK